ELGERVLFGRVFGDRCLDGSLGTRPIPDHLFEYPREIEPRADAVARGLRTRDATFVECRELLGATEHAMNELEGFEGVLEERAVVEETLERLAARGVIGDPLERLPQGRQPLCALPELVNLQHRETVQEVRLHPRVRLDGDAPLEDVGQTASVTKPAVKPIECPK